MYNKFHLKFKEKLSIYIYCTYIINLYIKLVVYFDYEGVTDITK